MKINNKKIVMCLFLSLFIVGFFTPFLRPVIEGSTFPDDITGLRLSSNADFYAISESDLTTRWILQGADINPVLNFTDDISGANWYLTDITTREFNYTVSSPTDDSWVWSSNPDDNYGADTLLDSFSHSVPAQDRNVYIEFDLSGSSDYFADNDSDYHVVMYYNSGTPGTHSIYKTTTFNENTITYNNAPALGALEDSITYAFGAPSAWYYYDVSDLNGIVAISAPTSTTSAEFHSKENTNDPMFIREISKEYFGGGYMYMQTGSTETIALQSTDYGNYYNLSSGDYFEVDFETSSDSQINLILMKDGVVNKSLILSPSGNSNFNRHTAQISVDEYVEFDQLKINSTFEAKDKIKIYDMKTYLYTLTGDYADFYLGSRRTYVVNLSSDTYNLRIFDPYDDDVKINENITIGTSDYFYIYEPISTIDCRLSLFNTGKENHLDFEDYHISINKSLNNEWMVIDLLDNIFTADIGTHVYVNVSDNFDTLIDEFDKIVSSYIDLELNVYTLQIKNLMEHRTTIDINSTHTYPLLSGESIYFILSTEYYQIGFYDNNNSYQQFTIYLDSNQAYELNRSKICFLSYADQQGNHLFFENYKTYINDSLIYENVFYREIGESIGIEIKDRYDISIKNETYIVLSEDNFIPITLTLYSLKVMNQQEIFNWINITRDPNYYESEMYWSEWIAPGEIIDFKMFAGYYKINLTDNENSGSSFYEYTLSGDDILLISSGNLLSNVLINIANVNVTLGNQITNVEINITNQNSAINNTVVNIEINLDNVNSTLGTMLTNIDLNITNIANNISSLYTFTNNSFINLDNNVNTSFIYLENNIIAINESISNLVIGIDNSISLINGTISTLILGLSTDLELINTSMSTLLIDLDTQLNLVNSSISTLVANFGTDLLLINTSINTALFNLNTTIDLIGNNITSNYILLNNTLNLIDNNIDWSRFLILNNLALVNNTISTLISQVYSSVYLVNNSIYTAVVDLGTTLSLINNSIDGNLTVILQQNEYLTELFQTTMFSELLDWTGIASDPNLIDSKIDVWEFINLYKDKAIEVKLRYDNLIETLTVSAQNTIDQYLPADDVEYRLWSVEDEEYLSDWEELPDTKTVDFGFYETEVPIEPIPILEEAFLQWFMVFIFVVIFSLGFTFWGLSYQSPEGKVKKIKQPHHKAIGNINKVKVLGIGDILIWLMFIGMGFALGVWFFLWNLASAYGAW